MLHSIGIGDDFDEDLIKNAATLGKGNYNFCKDLENLNNIIASEINKATSSYVTNIQIKSNLDDKNKIKNILPNILRDNSLINLYYILDNSSDKINFNIKYDEKEKEKTLENNYELFTDVLEKGDDLSKLIIYNYIKNNKNLSEEEKIKLALKYQILMKDTSLYSEISFSEKITEEMKVKIIGKKGDNVIPVLRPKASGGGDIRFCDTRSDEDFYVPRFKKCAYIGSAFRFDENDDDDEDIGYGISCKRSSPLNNNYNNIFEYDMIKSTSQKEEKKLDPNEKESIMKMVATQNFVEGYWEENEYTKEIKNKYQKEYEQIKGIKNKNMNDIIALTILIIYFLNKEYPDLISELVMIIKKAKQFISKHTNDSYDNIIKEMGLN